MATKPQRLVNSHKFLFNENEVITIDKIIFRSGALLYGSLSAFLKHTFLISAQLPKTFFIRQHQLYSSYCAVNTDDIFTELVYL